MPDTALDPDTMARALRRISRLYDEALAPCELTTGQFSVLAELLRAGDAPPGAGALAQQLQMSRSTLERYQRELQWKGLAETRAPVRGRRVRAFGVTAAGVLRAQEAARLWAAAERRLQDIHGARALLRLGEALESLAADPG
jgi:DNA-binding MarR family transcriptional regulator